jgi:hypothetical protein
MLDAAPTISFAAKPQSMLSHDHRSPCRPWPTSIVAGVHFPSRAHGEPQTGPLLESHAPIDSLVAWFLDYQQQMNQLRIKPIVVSTIVSPELRNMSCASRSSGRSLPA